MADIIVNVPGLGAVGGDKPIVILGPNGSGKTKLAQQIAAQAGAAAIGAQRRTWISDSIPVQQEEQLRNHMRGQLGRWRTDAWHATEEIDQVISSLIQDHTNVLTRRNQKAIDEKCSLEPVSDTKLMQMQSAWRKLYAERSLEIGGFFPTVKRTDTNVSYPLRHMSDGERTVLYMLARVLVATEPVILVDEPELHMHSRLAIEFWDEAERLRADRRFVYVTHDLNFALSRRDATILAPKADGTIKAIPVIEIPAEVGAQVLGAATLPFYAQRIYLYEGESGKGFASQLFEVWFDDPKTFAIPCGGCDAVMAAVAGLSVVGVAIASIEGLIDRDFKPDSILGKVPKGVTVLQLHEIESVVCDKSAVDAIAEHLGHDPARTWNEFLEVVRSRFRRETVNRVIAERVRARVGDLLDGAFTGTQIAADSQETAENHSAGLAALDIPTKTKGMFDEEARTVTNALASGGQEMLAILPGKHLFSILATILGFAATGALADLVIRALDRRQPEQTDAMKGLGRRLESAFAKYLPKR